MPSQADNAIQFSFDSPNALPSEAELRAVAASPDNPDSRDVPSPEPTPVLETPVIAAKPAVETPVVDTSVPKPSTEDLKTYKVKVNGEELTVTEADLLSGHMRHKDYTQKTQQIAEQQRAWAEREAQYQQTLQAYDAFLKDKAAVENYAKETFGINPAAPVMEQPVISNPSAPTLADIAKIAAYNAEQVRLSMAAEFAKELNSVKTENAQRLQQSQEAVVRQNLATELDTHVSNLLKQHPLLTKFEDIAEDLMADATKRLPKGSNLDHAKAELTAAAERRVAVLQSMVTEDKKAAAIQAAKLKNGSPEPPGGSPAKAVQGRKLTLNGSDQKEFRAAALADLEAFVAANH